MKSNLSVVPLPAHSQVGGEMLILQSESRVYVSGVHASVLALVLDKLRKGTCWDFPVTEGKPDNDAIPHLYFELNTVEKQGLDGYSLEVSGNCIHIQATTVVGLFYGGITLLQLLHPCLFDTAHPLRANGDTPFQWEVPHCIIRDAARFQWRGAMVDVARHFFPVDVIKRYLDQMALLKLNIFHWHLTDDQGWRIEIKKYPKLTEIGAWRKETFYRKGCKGDGVPHGGYYTQEQIREVVDYAASLNISVIPEIDMPGHMHAAIASYPELGCIAHPLEVCGEWGVNQNLLYPGPETIAFMQDVLMEVIGLFPFEYVHIGGDEAVKDQWRGSAKVQGLIQQLGLRNEDEMQSWFIGRINDFLVSKGKKLIGWDEITEGGLCPGATVMAWRHIDKGARQAVANGHDLVNAYTQGTYFYNFNISLEKAYAFNPIPEGFSPEEELRVLGTQGYLWSEHIPTEFQLHYHSFPRLCALAEVAWSPHNLRDYNNFRDRLRPYLTRLSAMDVPYWLPDC